MKIRNLIAWFDRSSIPFALILIAKVSIITVVAMVIGKLSISFFVKNIVVISLLWYFPLSYVYEWIKDDLLLIKKEV